jgi:hypothetical protein
VVGDFLDLGQLVVVGEDDRVSLRGQRPHLVRESLDLGRLKLGERVGLHYLEILHRGAPIAPGGPGLWPYVRRLG